MGATFTEKVELLYAAKIRTQNKRKEADKLKNKSLARNHSRVRDRYLR
jgi:hypothetical protein